MSDEASPWPRRLLVALVVVSLLTVVVAGSTSSEAFGTFNSAWDGASSVRAAAVDTGGEVTVITETSAYDEADGAGIAIVLAPTEPYTEEEAARIRDFVRRGGTLVVAEDVADGGNRLLSHAGAEVRFDGRLVYDDRHHGPTASMPVTTNVTQSRLSQPVDSVMLNHGTVLTNIENASVLVRSSRFSYLDADGNAEADDDETLQSYPVAAVERVGEGWVVSVGDPSVFINAMQERASNGAFLRALVDGHDRVLLDYSHGGTQPPVQAALLWLERTPLVLAGLGGIGVVLVARLTMAGDGIARLLRRVRDGDDHSRTPVDEASVLAYVRARYPDWDRERVRRLIADVMPAEENGEENE